MPRFICIWKIVQVLTSPNWLFVESVEPAMRQTLLQTDSSSGIADQCDCLFCMLNLFLILK